MTRFRRIAIATSLMAAQGAVGAWAAEEPREKGPAVAAQLGSRALAQIQALLDAKERRSPVERKIGSHLLAGIQETSGTVPAGVPHLRSAVRPDPDGTILVDIRGFGLKALASLVKQAGGTPLYLSDRDQLVRARLPFSAVESVAASGLVRSVRPSAKPMIADAPFGHPKPTSADVVATLRPGFERRAAQVRARLGALLAAGSGRIVSEGVVAHQADEAANLYGATGAGVKVGVLSSSVAFLADVQAAGELPAVTVLQDLDPSDPGYPGSGEGTAMLEIVHDMAPGAQLFFASAFNGEQSFADNIRALRAAGCGIIVDDVYYFDESPFQDGPVAAAVNDVTQSGALYFSSAGNQGNLDDGTSGVWEGNFKPATRVSYPPLAHLGYTLHDFGTDIISNSVLADGYLTFLFWNEAYGASKADYDLFAVDPNLQEIIDASTDTQNGDDDPIEFVFGPYTFDRLIVAKPTHAPVKRIHLNTFGSFLAIATAGQTHGHSSAAAAFSVAAVDAANAQGGPFSGGQQNPVEYFSSDGPRRIYFNALGKPAPALRKKPDLAAADGVKTSTPGFNPFYGTSAAAPHAAGVAALIKSVLPAATPATLRTLLTSSALDIEQRGGDRDSGAGIVMAVNALEKGKVQPIVNLFLNDAAVTAGTPDGDSYVEPGESATLAVEIVNVGGATGSAVTGNLSTTTPGALVTTATSLYPDIPPGATVGNTTPFAFALDPGAACGLKVASQLDLAFAEAPSSQTFHFSVQTGRPSATQVPQSYAGPSVPIPDNDATGVEIPLQVSGLARIADLNFSFDGSACSPSPFSTTSGLSHSYVGDLVVTLKSPQGTTVTLMHRPGGGPFGSSGHNFCQTVLDDDGGGASIDGITPGGSPYTGTFLPREPLSAFDGEDPNGTWILNVSDHYPGDSGSVNAFTLTFTGFDCN
jgi:subtilisin-like proprotein convertase family protein/subtilisin family serine protease